MSGNKPNQLPSRRTFLKGLSFAPLLLRPAPMYGSGMPLASTGVTASFAFSDFRLNPQYPAKSPLEDVLRRVAPGSDEYLTEGYAAEIERELKAWSAMLTSSTRDLSSLREFLDLALEASPLDATKEVPLRSGFGIDVVRRQFSEKTLPGREPFLQEVQHYLAAYSQIDTASFEITSLQTTADNTGGPLTVQATIRYTLAGKRKDHRLQQAVGSWQTEWSRQATGGWKARKWTAVEETVASGAGPGFIDVTASALGDTESYASQLLLGADYWRTVLDGACGIDVYGNNGVAAGDFDNDGFDDLYVCQAAGLPNRLYRNRGDGTFDDVTEKAGVGVLDGTACALFADFRNKGLQDLLVVCGSGPLLFLNQGDGTFAIQRDAFQFKTPPQGTFTHAALADYDRDGRLDIYFCLYSYYVGLDQYHYPVPYFDARNGPPNFLLHNRGDGTFEDRTEAAGLNAENNRYSFACAWSDYDGSGFPDLYVANDFGRANLYRNQGNGAFAAVSTAANVEDVGAGMSAAWSDYENKGQPSVYSANMWSAAGQRVSEQSLFHEQAPAELRALYQRHARGNALYRNQGDGKFENVGERAGVAMGRWSWCSDFWDFDHDGYPDLYVANGYISAPERSDLSSFFWRQVVGKSPNDSTPAAAYERGWQALNELIRSDSTWAGYEKNVLFANNRDGTFSEVSGVAGLDFVEDGRSFALADLDHDGRLEVILKNRNAPQLRVLHNSMEEIGQSVVFRLRGTRSNRDAIGAAITLEAGSLRQTRYLQAGSGFLAQHSKEVFFGIGKERGLLHAVVRWPSGLSQDFDGLPANHRIEIEEGSPAFSAKPFGLPPVSYAHPKPLSVPEQLPSTVGTWLAQPLKGPEFSLIDLGGSTRQLRSLRGGYALLSFWAAASPASVDQLHLLGRNQGLLAGARLAVMAINVDEAAHSEAARSLAKQHGFAFPVLFATEEFAGIYNITYRYLFDRRRNLGIPTSLLVDDAGMIVKIYQGPVTPQQLVSDVTAAPRNAGDRKQGAIPFPGALYQGTFQRNDFTYGVAMFQHGYLDQAAESFEQVVAAKPDDPEAYYNLGTLNLRRNDFKRARHFLEETLKLRPDYPEAWNNFGMMAAQEGRADEAIQSFRRSLELRPEYAIALLNLGNVYRRQGLTAQAEDCLHRALQLQPGDPEINYNLGMLYAQQNQMQSAAEYLGKALELRPDYPEAMNNLGVLFVRQRDYAKAEEEFQTCIRTVPGFDQSYLNLARLYAMQGDMQKARQSLSELLRLQPQNAAAAQALEVLH